ncbi:MAG TPA: hypothetical protein VK961_20525, partial [Chthoniobacter sp.]|nr:hypothetical protein [Chthoniobacter sp.]
MLDELRHLFWSPGEIVKEKLVTDVGGEEPDFPDAGWNCRDHTMVTCFLAAMSGLESQEVIGEVFFIDPALHPAFPSKMLRVSPHVWTQVRGHGIYDLSLRLHRLPENWEPWTLWAVHGGMAYPRTSATISTLAAISDVGLAQKHASHESVRLVAYLPEKARSTTADGVRNFQQ